MEAQSIAMGILIRSIKIDFIHSSYLDLYKKPEIRKKKTNITFRNVEKIK